jgi:thiamine-monophosphate kinase
LNTNGETDRGTDKASARQSRQWSPEEFAQSSARASAQESASGSGQAFAGESAEDRLIATYFRPIATHPGAFGLADDAAAVTPPPGCDIVLTTDGLISGVHFFSDDPADAVARKALRINLSDLAAKGAAPLGFLLSLALPAGLSPGWLEGFARGLGEDAMSYDCPLLGGDTDKSPIAAGGPGAITVHVTALGTVPSGGMVRRAGAAPGQRILVTGTIGDAALGLMLRQDASAAARWGLDTAMRDHLLDRYLLPQPRNAIASTLRRHGAAAMDISDGLAGDLAKLCRASGVAADIAVEQVPLSAAARQALASEPSLIETILTGGDDYEIAIAADADAAEALRAEAASAGLIVTEIGTFAAGPPRARFRIADGRELAFAKPSYSHF